MNYKQNENLHYLRSIIFENEITVLGNSISVPKLDEEWEFFGTLVFEKGKGYQFKSTEAKPVFSATESGIIQYFSSDIFPSIGPVTAKMIAEKLGDQAVSLLEADEKILDTLKLTTEQKKAILKGLSSDRKQNKAVAELFGLGFTYKSIKNILEVYKDNSLQKVKENPYALIKKIHGFGFLKADQVASKLGFPKNSKVRLKALFLYELENYIYGSGNLGILKILLYEQMEKRISEKLGGLDTVLQELISEGEVILNDDLIYLSYLYNYEKFIASFIKNHLKGQGVFRENEFTEALFKSELEEEVVLDSEQKTAIVNSLVKPVSIITGGPGTGKTMVVKQIVNLALKKIKPSEIALLAPTGRASKRMFEATGYSAMTIHRFLSYKGDDIFNYDKEELEKYKLIIIDEFSMIDVVLFYELLKALPVNTSIVIVGDINQLPSVGPGNVLADLIESKAISVTTLKTIYRQKDGSGIAKLAQAIMDEEVNKELLEANDVNFIEVSSNDVLKIIKEIIEKLQKDNVDILRDLQILIPMYKGITGINQANVFFQDAINSSNPLQASAYKVGDKVIQLVNRPQDKVMNGDLGVITEITERNGKLESVTVNFFSGPIITYTSDNFDDLMLSYAMTVHKAQGSEFPYIIMVVSSEHSFMLRRKLLYTGITRAKKKLFLIGSQVSFSRGIKELEDRRNTKLLKLLTDSDDSWNETMSFSDFK